MNMTKSWYIFDFHKWLCGWNTILTIIFIAINLSIISLIE